MAFKATPFVLLGTTGGSNMNSSPDAVQEWVRFWLQQMCSKGQVISLLQTQNPAAKEFVSVVMQTWQQNCDLWANSLMASLPEDLAAPIAASLQRSQNDLRQILETAAKHRRTHEDGSEDVIYAGLTANPGLSTDPRWTEHLLAFNEFAQLHIRYCINWLEKLRDKLTEQPQLDLKAVLQSMPTNGQTDMCGTHYQQVLQRLQDSLLALSMPTDKSRSGQKMLRP